MCLAGGASEWAFGYKSHRNNEAIALRFLQSIYAVRLGSWCCSHGTSSGTHICAYWVFTITYVRSPPPTIQPI